MSSVHETTLAGADGVTGRAGSGSMTPRSTPLWHGLVIAATSAVLTTGLGALLLFFTEVPLKIQANRDAREANAAQIKWILGEIEKVRTEIRNHHHGQDKTN